MFYANGLPKSGSEVNQVTPYIINAFDISNVQLLNFKQWFSSNGLWRYMQYKEICI